MSLRRRPAEGAAAPTQVDHQEEEPPAAVGTIGHHQYAKGQEEEEERRLPGSHLRGAIVRQGGGQATAVGPLDQVLPSKALLLGQRGGGRAPGQDQSLAAQH